MASRSERVLVTGPDSFTGRHLCAALRADGHHVIELGRRPTAAIRFDLTAPPDNLGAMIAAEAPTALVHLAGISFTASTDLFSLYAVNVAGAAALLQAAAKATTLRSVVLASSAKVYAPPPDGAPLDERAPLAPSDHYGASKLALEHVARLFQSTLPITILRPFNYIGPGQTSNFLVPKIVRAYVRGEPLEIGNLDLRRDFSDIGTVVDVYRRFVADPAPGAVVNVCAGETVRLADIPVMVRDLVGRDVAMSVNPAFVRSGEAPVIVGSTARLEETVGPLQRKPIRATLAEMVAAERAAL